MNKKTKMTAVWMGVEAQWNDNPAFWTWLDDSETISINKAAKLELIGGEWNKMLTMKQMKKSLEH